MVPPLNSRTQGSGLVVVPIAEVGLGKVFGALTEEVRFAQDFPLKTDSNLWFRISGKRFFYIASEPQTGREPQPVLTTDNGRFTVGRARLAPAMISTPGHRASRRRQHEALPAWCNVIGSSFKLHGQIRPQPHLGSVQCRAERKRWRWM
jgi:hypothetical protein